MAKLAIVSCQGLVGEVPNEGLPLGRMRRMTISAVGFLNLILLVSLEQASLLGAVTLEAKFPGR